MIAKRRAATAREAYICDRGSGVARHTLLISERRVAMARKHTSVTAGRGFEAYAFDSKAPGG